MELIRKFYVKFYHRAFYFFYPPERIQLPDDLKKSINLFIYFDYEREFGGHDTTISNSNIDSLLSILSKVSIHSTWFTVGKIIESYPDSIKSIINNNHELASHTFNHIPPLFSYLKMEEDFNQFAEKSPVRIQGFHSPKGQWSMKSLKLLGLFDYQYDVTRIPKTKVFFPFKQSYRRSIVRLQTVGDDWQLYNNNVSENQCFDYFLGLFNKLNVGDLAGIGFHPWVLYSDINILKGFERFINYIKTQKNVQIFSAIEFVNKLKHLK